MTAVLALVAFLGLATAALAALADCDRGAALIERANRRLFGVEPAAQGPASPRDLARMRRALSGAAGGAGEGAPAAPLSRLGGAR